MKRLKATAITALFISAADLRPAAGLVDAPDVDLVRQTTALKADTEAKIQSDILDPILGKGQAKVFMDLELEYVTNLRETTKQGAGMAERYKEKPGARAGAFATQFILPGVPKPKNITQPSGGDKPSAAQGQVAVQEREEKEQYFGLKTEVKKLQVTVVHNDSLLTTKPEQDAVRSRIVDALAHFKATPDQVVFRPTRFNRLDWREDFKKPEVYLPLLYAALLLFFLMFLFGPLARFFRKYVEALLQKPAAEVNVESKIEQPEEEDEGPGGPEESKLDIMLGRKPPEPPPESEEDEAMKKFEPFSYINEENLKRLGNLFLLRREEPWLIAVVLSYLKPEYARQVLTTLPVELQAKVAMEALKVRQVTREQVVAIDAEIKESVDFVVGGMERLVQLLEESDTHTRQNILEYLKNDKPATYERVRKWVLTFEDVVNFPDRDMQTIVRELKTESMAKALQGAPPDVVQKFLSNMSAGAASLLKESMEYTKGLTPAQVEEERSKIIDVVKALEKEGKVAVRQRPEGVGEGFQEELAVDREQKYVPPSSPAGSEAPAGARISGGQPVVPTPAPTQRDPAMSQQYLAAGAQMLQAGRQDEALQYLQAAAQLDPDNAQAQQYLGTALHQAGRVGEALACFERLLRLNPDPQLKAWVDSFKAQAR